MGYREFPPATPLRELVETSWIVEGPGDAVEVLPDGCMDLIRMAGDVIVAGPDIQPVAAAHGAEPLVGMRFRPGVLPRLLGVPAAELVGTRVPLDDLRPGTGHRSSLSQLAIALASERPRAQTAPWSLGVLHYVTAQLASGMEAAAVAGDVGWSPRTLQRQCGGTETSMSPHGSWVSGRRRERIGQGSPTSAVLSRSRNVAR